MDSVDPKAAEAALAALPKAQRDEVLSLPTNEAMFIIKLLVTFPGSRFEEVRNG